METQNQGWTFADSEEVPWQAMGPGVEMKSLGVAGGRLMALFRFDAGYEGGVHHHDDAEFTYVLDGDLVSNGVTMLTGHGYAVEAGTDHTEFRSAGGATVLSVFAIPG